MKFKYKLIAIAGTFDRLHKGHRFFIQQAFKLGDRVVIGLTIDKFARSKRESRIKKPAKGAGRQESRILKYEERKRELENFLRQEKFFERAEIVMINDIYGPSLKQDNLEALIITEETRDGGEKVNRKRKELKLRDLKLIEVPLVQAEDNQRISSTRIRLGEIDRWGRVFERLAIFGGKIADDLRLRLKKPLGRLISGSEQTIVNETVKLLKMNPVCSVAVGDEATSFLNKLGSQADISVVDFFIKRVRVHESLEDLEFADNFYKASYPNKIIRTKNPAGYIKKELLSAVKEAFKAYIKDGRKRVIFVEGEEDLAGLPAILLAPLDSLILYGQPNRGVVAVRVTEEKKKEILKMVESA